MSTAAAVDDVVHGRRPGLQKTKTRQRRTAAAAAAAAAAVAAKGWWRSRLGQKPMQRRWWYREMEKKALRWAEMWAGTASGNDQQGGVRAGC